MSAGTPESNLFESITLHRQMLGMQGTRINQLLVSLDPVFNPVTKHLSKNMRRKKTQQETELVLT